MSEKAKQHLRKINLGKKLSEKTKRKISIANKGRKLSLAVRHKFSLMRRGANSHFFGKKQSIKHRKKRSEAQKGEKHYNWKGGKSLITKRIRRSVEYRLWRTAVFERDNYTCIWCGARSQKGLRVILNADHIKPFAYYPELRFAIDNGRTLCEECHKKTDTFGYKANLNNSLNINN